MKREKRLPSGEGPAEEAVIRERVEGDDQQTIQCLNVSLKLTHKVVAKFNVVPHNRTPQKSYGSNS